MNNLLNLEPQKVSKDIRNYSSFIYGICKIGKTTLVHELYGEDVLFIATENRYKALNGAYVQKVNSWSEFKTTLNQLANPKVKERWQVVCVDTVDNLAKMCDKFIAQKYGEEHCGDKLISYGRDWVDLRQEWDDSITMIDKLGYTPCFISHAMIKTVKIPVESMLETDIVGAIVDPRTRKSL